MRTQRLLVVVSNRENYFEALAGEDVEVDQAPWQDIEIASHADSCVFFLRPQANAIHERQKRSRSFVPDLVLIRSYALGGPGHDHRVKLYTLMHANLPCVNSLDSFAWGVEKAVMWGKLREVPGLPLPPQTCYSGAAAAGFQPDFPSVVKVGSASQGLGKARVLDAEGWKDSLSLLGMVRGEYFTSEPFMEWVYDVRVQYIGGVLRAIKRTKTASGMSWKANDGFGIAEEDVEVEERWARWARQCSRHLGMDILGLDIIGDKEGREFVLECNGSSIGFPPRHREEDVGHIVAVVLKRLHGPVLATEGRAFVPRWRAHTRKFVAVLPPNLEPLVQHLRDEQPFPSVPMPLLGSRTKMGTSSETLAACLFLEVALLQHPANPLLLEAWNLSGPLYLDVMESATSAKQLRLDIENMLELMSNELKIIQAAL